MADEIYWLDPESCRKLRELLRREAGTVRNTQQRPRSENEEPTAPEVYVARPTSGIPGRVGMVPGSAPCEVYRVLEDSAGTQTLTAIDGLTRTVLNLWADGISRACWLLLNRDKWGAWYVAERYCDAEGDTGTGTGTGPDTGGTSGDCVCQPGVVYYTDINNFLTFDENTFYFNSYDNSVNVNVSNTWYTYYSFPPGGGYTGTQIRHREACISGIVYVYAHAETFANGLLASVSSEWFAGYNGCCDCGTLVIPPAFTGTGTGTGSTVLPSPRWVVYNTGVDDSSVALDGSTCQPDPHWQADGATAWSLKDSDIDPVYYLPDDASSRWISFQCAPDTPGPVDYQYTLRFVLPSAVDPASVYLEGRCLADDDVIEVYVNGVPQGVSRIASGDFMTWTDFTLTGFQAGANEVLVVVRNLDVPAPNGTALRLEWTKAVYDLLGGGGGDAAYTVTAILDWDEGSTDPRMALNLFGQAPGVALLPGQAACGGDNLGPVQGLVLNHNSCPSGGSLPAPPEIISSSGSFSPSPDPWWFWYEHDSDGAAYNAAAVHLAAVVVANTGGKRLRITVTGGGTIDLDPGQSSPQLTVPYDDSYPGNSPGGADGIAATYLEFTVTEL